MIDEEFGRSDCSHLHTEVECVVGPWMQLELRKGSLCALIECRGPGMQSVVYVLDRGSDRPAREVFQVRRTVAHYRSHTKLVDQVFLKRLAPVIPGIAKSVQWDDLLHQLTHL